MRIDSVEFLLLAFVTVVVCGIARGGLRRAAMTASSLVFFASFASGPLSLLPICGFVLFGYVAILAASHFRGYGILGLLVLWVVILFVWIKHYSILMDLPDIAFVYSTVGLSYLLFRIIHLMVDVGQGSLRSPGLGAYLGYIFFFLSFSSGPVQRYSDFRNQIDAEPAPLTVPDLTKAIDRIVLGYFLLTVVDAACVWVFEKLSIRLTGALVVMDFSTRTALLFTGIAPLYMLHVYVNFSAYMHVVIGIGELMGLQLPENFRFPLATRNFLDFWSRWHITLSEWFRDYMFNPLLKALLRLSLPAGLAPYLAAIAFFVTFGAIGMWHGTSFAFVVLGLMFGFGASINKIWQINMPKWLGRQQYKALCQRSWYLQISRALTLSYIAVSLTCVWITADALAPLLTGEGAALALVATLILTVTGSLASFIWDAVGPITLPRTDPVRFPVRAAAWTALAIFVVLNLALAVNSASDIIYKDF